MTLSIKSLLLCCLALAMLSPSAKVAGVTLFDLSIYGVLFLCLLQTVAVNGFRIRRLSHVELALGTIAIISLATYAVGAADFRASGAADLQTTTSDTGACAEERSAPMICSACCCCCSRNGRATATN